MLMAVLVLITGIGVCVAAGYYNTDRFLNSPGGIQTFSDRIVTAMLVAGLICITISLLGCSVIRIQSVHLSRCYGCWLIPSFVILFVCSVQFGMLMTTADKGLTALCGADHIN
jgi:hypothetical protein